MKGNGTKLLLALLLLCMAASMQALASETLVEVKRIEPTKTESGYLVVKLDEDKVDRFFTYPNELFLPGDVAEGTFRFRLQPGIKPVKLKLTAANLGEEEAGAMFDSVCLEITNGSTKVYDGKLSGLKDIEIAAYQNDSRQAVDETVELKLEFEKKENINMLQGRALKFSLTVTADMMDYTVIRPADYVPGDAVEVYRSHYNNKYYYTVSGVPALERQHVAKGEKESYFPDFELNVGDLQGDEDDYYIDEDNLKVYIGQDLHFGTADDAKSLLTASGKENGANVRRGTDPRAAKQFGGADHAGGEHYTNGADGIPGTADDMRIYAGRDGVFGTADDFYIVSGQASVRPGNNLIWNDETEQDDQMWSVGADGKHGSLDDTFLGYPNRTTEQSGGHYSGNNAISGSFDSSVSPVGFAKAIEGTWSKDALGRWNFVSNDGEKARSKWINIYSRTLDQSDWYYFDSTGAMQTGWQKTGGGKWYYLRTEKDAREGAMTKGLYQDNGDGNYYYLDPVNGVMQTGWQKINDKYYYFAEVPVGTTWFWNSSIGKWAASKLGGKPTGAMYRNEITPDGSRVDENGARVNG